MAPKARENKSPSPLWSSGHRPISRVSGHHYRQTRGRYAYTSANANAACGQFPVKRVPKNRQVYAKGQRRKNGDKSYVVQVNPKLARLRALRDLKLPTMGARFPGANALRMAGNAAIFAAVAVDTLRVSSALYTDLKGKGKPGKLTVKTSASVGSGWLGSFGGAWGGHAAGAWIGGTMGSFFGGLGMIPGAAIGAMVGVVAGGMMGGFVGSRITETVVDKCVADSDQEDNDQDDNDNEDENDNYVDLTTKISCEQTTTIMLKTEDD